VALLELSAFPAGCAPSERSRGPPLVPGSVVPVVVVGGVAAVPAGRSGVLFCANASVLVTANALAKASVGNFIG
jgi:hypothetical protein